MKFSNVILLFITIILFLIVAEIAARIIMDIETSGYGNSPGNKEFDKYVIENEFGFRDESWLNSKEKTILLIGDSFTWGAGIKNVSNTYPAIVEKRINYTIYSVAKPGWNTEHHLKALKRYMPLKPDIVIIAYSVNDPEIGEVVDRFGIYDYILPQKLGHFMMRNSYLYYFVQTSWFKAKTIFGLRATSPEIVDYSLTNEKILIKHFENLDKIRKITTENNAKLAFIILPLVTEEEYQFKKSQIIITNYLKSRNIKYLDMLEHMQDKGQVWLNKNDFHYNELGHQIIANKTVNFIDSLDS